VTHNNELLWDVVTFMRKLPDLSPEQYQSNVKSAPKSHGEMMQDMEMDLGGFARMPAEVFQLFHWPRCANDSADDGWDFGKVSACR
jgi:hypothetical protein